MTKKLSFLALFAAAMLCAAPALSLKNAFQPDANLALSMNLGTINSSFVGEYVNNDIIGSLAGFVEQPIDPNDPTQAMLKALIERSTITLSVHFNADDVQGIDELEPADALKKFVVCIEFPQPLGPLVDVMIGQLSAVKRDGMSASPLQINDFKGMKVTSDEGLAVAVAFSADTKFAFLGNEESLKKQLTEEAAAAAPAKLVTALKQGYAGGTATLAIAVTDEIKSLAGQTNPEAAGYLSTVETITVAVNTLQSTVDIKLAAAFTDADTAAGVKTLLDEQVIPGAKQMAPAFANGADLAFVNTFAAAQEGNSVSLSVSLNQKDIMCIGQIAMQFMMNNQAQDDDDDDGVETIPASE
ncbi:MAG: hypothetical protein J6Y80_00560 [Victivallales bacterium]|nr:hypothetical protein [Victivallales bacterium]